MEENAPPALVLSVIAQPEKPKGPKSRLVIHKLMLVNFKSYAGRQEIGPFHKVSVLYSDLARSPSDTGVVVVLGNRRPQWFWQIQHYRRVAVRVREPSFEAATGKALRVDPQLGQLSRPS
jgi:hypothetical protein